MMRAPVEPPRDSKTMKTTSPNRIQRLLNRGKDSSWPGAIADSVPFYSCSATEVRKVNTQLTARPREQVIAAIQALDLDPIKFKLMDPEEGQGWSREYVNQMAIEYKRFLTLSVKYSEETIAPSKDVDKFWHGHILDTMKYAEDCQNVYGYFLHHFPYFGMRGEEDAANLAEAGRTTQRLYEQEFGEALPSRSSDSALCGVAKPANVSALCGVARKADSALCGVSKPALCGVAKPANVSALCGVARKADRARCGVSKPALCGVAKPANVSALCGVAKKADSALCGVSKPALCGVAKPANVSALCGVARQADSALCGVNKPAYDKLNTSVRPRLALAA